MRTTSYLVALIALSGCGTPEPATCGDAECAAICDAKGPKEAVPAEEPGKGPDLALTSFTADLLGPMVEDIQGGVRPFGEEGIGICKGTRQCDEFLGTDGVELPAGKYMVRAELQVPNIGEKGTWKVKFDTKCTTIRKTENGETSSSSDYSREYDVRYAGKDRGYRLQPLRTIESPSRGGARECSYTLTAPHPDGDKVYSGKWSTPEAPS
jgi:hypothetical protein